MTNQEIINKFTMPDKIIPGFTDWKAICQEQTLSDEFREEFKVRL